MNPTPINNMTENKNKYPFDLIQSPPKLRWDDEIGWWEMFRCVGFKSKCRMIVVAIRRFFVKDKPYTPDAFYRDLNKFLNDPDSRINKP